MSELQAFGEYLIILFVILLALSFMQLSYISRPVKIN